MSWLSDGDGGVPRYYSPPLILFTSLSSLTDGDIGIACEKSRGTWC